MQKSTQKMQFWEVISLNLKAFGLLFKMYKGLMLVTVLNTVLHTSLPYLNIFFSARIIEKLAGTRRKEELISMVITVLAVNAAGMIITAVLSRITNKGQLMRNLKNKRMYVQKLMSMDFATIDNSHTHDLYSQIEQNEQWNSWGLMRSYGEFARIVSMFTGLGGAITLSITLFTSRIPNATKGFSLLNNPLSAIVMLLLMLGTSALSSYAANKSARYHANYSKSARFGNRIMSALASSMYNDKANLDMRMYRQDIVRTEKTEECNVFGVKSQLAKYAKGAMGIYSAIASAISKLFSGIVYIFVGLKAYGGAFGIGYVSQYVGAITSLYGSLAGGMNLFGEMQNNAGFLKDVFAFLDIPNEMYKGSITVEKRSDCKYEIEFRNVSFKYPNTEKYALRNVSAKFAIGSKMAVVGENGSGKTTFIKLLCRLYDPTEGTILLNGIDIRKYNYQEYLNVFSVVFQDYKLLGFTLGENIAAGGSYDADRVIKSIKKAEFYDRFSTMEKGLSTYLYKQFNNEGVIISGGEAQKIAIARGVYKDSPFIILDEPTAALDPLAEYEIYTNFNKIVEDKTAIFISHRLSSCRFCDKILVFYEGELIQEGSHERLVSDKNGKYYELWQAQAQYYVENAG